MSWIQTKAGLEMAEVIIRYLPRITVCLEELAKNNPVNKYRDDIIHIAEQIDIREQENINLKSTSDGLIEYFGIKEGDLND